MHNPAHSLTLDEAQAWVLIISTIATAIVSIITAIMTKKVHTLTNSAMTEERTRNSILQTLLAAKQVEIDAAERARVALAMAAGTGAPAPVTIVAETPVPVQVVPRPPPR